MSFSSYKGIMNLLKKICSALAVSILFVGFAIAEENKEVFNKSKTVRIGFYQDPRFQEGLSDDVRKTGYGYEYYKKVAAYNGWKYEYVYGEFDTLFEKLKTGEIDVLGGITYSTERSQYFYYPDFSMGNLRYYLFQNVDNPIINPKYQNSFKGKVIGGIKQGHMIDYLMEWGKRNSYEINVKNYDNSEKQIEDLRAKKIDAIVSRAITTYCKLNFGEPDDYDRLKRSYDEQKAQLSMATGYTVWIDQT